MNSVVNSNLEKMELLILAPGATQKSVKVNIEVQEKTNHKLYVSCTGENDRLKQFEQVDFSFEHIVDVQKMYDPKSVVCEVKDGTILITMKTDTSRIVPIEVK